MAFHPMCGAIQRMRHRHGKLETARRQPVRQPDFPGRPVRCNDMRVVPAADPSAHWTPGCSHGATLSRARQYIAQGLLPAGYSLLLVPAACGSTSILHWDKTVGYNVDLWGDLAARLEMALSLPNATQTWFVWRQVENDLNAAAHRQNKLHALMPDAATWLAHTEPFLQNFRNQFGNVPISLRDRK